MPFDDLTTVTVTGHAVKLDGTAASGSVTFESTASLLQDTTSGEAIFPVPLVATFDGTGHISIALPATDDPDIQPQGWVYNVTVAVTGSTTEQFQLSVPYTSAPFDLFRAAPIPESGVVWVPPAPATSDDNWGFLLLMRGRT